MRIVIQRVSEASVSVAGEIISKIEEGFKLSKENIELLQKIENISQKTWIIKNKKQSLHCQK